MEKEVKREKSICPIHIIHTHKIDTKKRKINAKVDFFFRKLCRGKIQSRRGEGDFVCIKALKVGSSSLARNAKDLRKEYRFLYFIYVLHSVSK